jgi:hypothetical protein
MAAAAGEEMVPVPQRYLVQMGGPVVAQVYDPRLLEALVIRPAHRLHREITALVSERHLIMEAVAAVLVPPRP